MDTVRTMDVRIQRILTDGYGFLGMKARKSSKK
ncbi:MAG: hypothetical protein RL329_1418 [Bacteroidota bacterium]